MADYRISTIVTLLFIIPMQANQPSLGDKCMLSTGNTGSCSDIRTCVGAKRQLNLGYIPEHCGWADRLVCCEDARQVKIRLEAPYNCQSLAKMTTRTKTDSKAWNHCLSLATSVQKCSANKKSATICPLVWKDQCNHIPKHYPAGGSRDISSKNEFPYIVYLWKRYNTTAQLVPDRVGTILSDRWVISVATNMYRHIYLLEVGSSTRSYRNTPGSELFEILSWVFHPENNSANDDHNLALWKTKLPLIFSESVRPACLQIGILKSSDKLLATSFYNTSGRILLKKDTWEQLDLIRCKEEHPNRTWLRSYRHACAWTGINPWMSIDHHVMAYSEDVYCTYNLVGIGHSVMNSFSRYLPYTKISFYIPWIESYVWP